MLKGSLMIIEGVSFAPLLKARAKFERYRHNFSLDEQISLDEEQKRSGAIQAFEFCYELAWKTMRKLLLSRGVTANSPKETFRLAALNGLIDDPAKWIDFIDLGNITVHTYDEQRAYEAVLEFDNFSNSLTHFLEHVKAI